MSEKQVKSFDQAAIAVDRDPREVKLQSTRTKIVNAHTARAAMMQDGVGSDFDKPKTPAVKEVPRKVVVPSAMELAMQAAKDKAAKK
jgi:hypothetical protein